MSIFLSCLIDRRVYWAEKGAPGAVMYRSMDDPAEQPTTVVSTFILEPIGLAVDHQNQRIYWVDNHFKM